MVSVVFLMEYLARLWVHNDIHKNIIKADDESKFLNKNYEVWKVFGNSLGEKFSYTITPPGYRSDPFSQFFPGHTRTLLRSF